MQTREEQIQNLFVKLSELTDEIGCEMHISDVIDGMARYAASVVATCHKSHEGGGFEYVLDAIMQRVSEAAKTVGIKVTTGVVDLNEYRKRKEENKLWQ